MTGGETTSQTPRSGDGAGAEPGRTHDAPTPAGSRQAAREEIWKRLRELVELAEGREPDGGRVPPLRSPARARGIARLDGEQMSELGHLYRATATHLAQARTFGASARRLDHLNRLVARAHAVVYGRPVRRLSFRVLLGSFVTFPIVIRRTFRFHAAAALLLAVGGLYGYHGAARDPEWALEFVAPGDERTPFADREELLEALMTGREGHESVDAGWKTAFATQLWLHNTRVALLGFFGGLLLGLPTVVLVIFNGALLGVYTATYCRHDLAYEWWAWILPHGVTELLAVVLLSGGGLYLGWVLLMPGARTRRAALWHIRGAVVQIVIFVFPMLLLAAVIESFVRQSNLSDPARYWFALASALFWIAYLGLVGRSRERRQPHGSGEGETLAEARVPLPEVEELAGLR